MRALRRPEALLAAALALAPWGVARAQTAPWSRDATARFRAAVEHVDQGRFDAARAAFQEVYGLTRDPRLLFNLAAVSEAQGDVLAGLAALDAFEREAPEALRRARATELAAARGRMEARSGRLRVLTEAPGMSARVDGALVELPRLREGLRLAVGPHQVELAAPDHRTQVERFELAGGSLREVRAPLERLRSTVTVRCDVPEAEVRIDDAVVGRTPLEAPVPVDAGAHRVRVARPGYRPFEGSVEARDAGAELRVELPWLDPVPASEGGSVRVRTNAAGAAMTLDGVAVARDGARLVPAGTHRLRLAHAEYLPAERDVQVPVGAALALDLRLEPAEALRAQRERARRTWRIVGWSALGAGAAAAIAGVVAVFGAEAKQRELRGDEATLVDALAQCDAGQCPRDAARADVEAQLADVRRDLDRPQRFVTAWSILGVGALLAGAGAVVLLVAPRRDRVEGPLVRLEPWPGGMSLRAVW